MLKYYRQGAVTTTSPRRFSVTLIPENTTRPAYDPTTGKLLGIWVEDQRTNYLATSSDLSSAYWGTSGTTVPTITNSGIDNTVTFTGAGKVYQNSPHVVNSYYEYVFSARIRVTSASHANLTIGIGESTAESTKTVTLSNTYQLVTVSVTKGVSSGQPLYVEFSYTGTGSPVFEIKMCQAENGLNPSSYIHNSSNVLATRHTDDIEADSNMDPDSGSFAVNFYLSSTNTTRQGYPTILSLKSSTNPDTRINVFSSGEPNSELRVEYTNHTGTRAILNLSGLTINGMTRSSLVGTYSNNTLKISFNGGTIHSAVATTTINPSSDPTFAESNSYPLNGVLSSFTYEPTTVWSDSIVQKLGFYLES